MSPARKASMPSNTSRRAVLRRLTSSSLLRLLSVLANNVVVFVVVTEMIGLMHAASCAEEKTAARARKASRQSGSQKKNKALVRKVNRILVILMRKEGSLVRITYDSTMFCLCYDLRFVCFCILYHTVDQLSWEDLTLSSFCNSGFLYVTLHNS